MINLWETRKAYSLCNLNGTPLKRAVNVSRHGVSFDEAKTVFDDPLYVDFCDPDHSDEEHRYIIVGESQQG